MKITKSVTIDKGKQTGLQALSFLLLVIILIVTSCVVSFAEDNVAYDASLNTLPDKQGWLPFIVGNDLGPTIDGNQTLHHDATAPNSVYNWYKSPAGAINFDAKQTLAMEVNLKITKSTYKTYYNPRRWRSGFGFAIIDANNRVFIVGISEKEVRLTTSAQWRDDKSSMVYKTDTTSSFNLYRLQISQHRADLFINDDFVLALNVGDPQNMTSWGSNAVRFGDFSQQGDSVTDLSFVHFKKRPSCDQCGSWKNHGQYVSCVTQAVNDLVNDGYYSSEEGAQLVSMAAKSDIGKKGYIATDCQ